MYESEYGSHMKQEVNQSMAAIGSNITMSQAMAKTSAFGSFFNMVN